MVCEIDMWECTFPPGKKTSLYMFKLERKKNIMLTIRIIAQNLKNKEFGVLIALLS